MSKRLYIVVEGQTEEEFVNSLMAPFFQESGIYVYPVIIHTSKGHKGGFVNYDHLKNDVTRLLKSQGQDVVVSTFVDFFRCPALPTQKEIDLLQSNRDKVIAMEKGISFDINDSRFIPYIQLHEFEAVLFSSISGFNRYFGDDISYEIQNIIDSFENPEDINSSPATAPSKRLIKIIPEYDKVMYGNILALENGFECVLERCKRFREWIEILLERCK